MMQRKSVDIETAMRHCNLGWKRENEDDADGAVAEFRKAITICPDLAAAHFGLGVALSDRDEFEKAIP